VQSFERGEHDDMNLRSLFRVSPMPPAPPKAERERMPSVIDVDIDYVDEPQPRGRSFETWTRARGWASED
jgi:hypothetical protein